ncbi:MAG: 4-hydroxy-tetrahydrodipicolinate reductase [Bdellovibrionales bacterium]
MKSHKNLKLGIIGSSGRMGIEVQKAAEEMGFSISQLINSENLSTFLKNTQKPKVDIWIDFSAPKVLNEILGHLQKYPAPLVSGTTGIDKEIKAKLLLVSKKSPVFWAPNMSIGVAVVTRMLEAFDGLDDFDFQIDETHHKRKKDRPSGTAILLQDKLQEVMGRKKIPSPLAIRGGGVYGIHRIQAFSEEEIISIEHTALNRRVFAKGALWAAEKIAKYKSGYFEMKDLFKK